MKIRVCPCTLPPRGYPVLPCPRRPIECFLQKLRLYHQHLHILRILLEVDHLPSITPLKPVHPQLFCHGVAFKHGKTVIIMIVFVVVAGAVAAATKSLAIPT